MKRKLIALLVLSTSLAAGAAMADGFALGAKASTLGLGVEATFGLSDRFNLRAGINNYSRSLNETESDIDYQAKVDLKNGALVFDFHPFAGAFRISAGLVSNGNEFKLTATPTNGVTIGGTFFPGSTAGTLAGDVTFKKSAPYVGIGWGNAVGKGSPLGINFEIGALLQGKAGVTLTSSNSSVSQNDLQDEARQIEDDIPKVYPVVALGLSYRF